jgi:KamA family protein
LSTLGPKLADLPHLRQLDPEIRRDIRIVSTVLPFKVNDYVLNELIDWTNVPNDPIFRLTFPHRNMLPKDMYHRVAQLLDGGLGTGSNRTIIEGLRRKLDPYLDDKPTRNRPSDEAGLIDGLMHKYPDSVLFFPPEGQTCHAYCGYCYRWGQLVGPWEVKQQVNDIERVLAYIRNHTEISDVLLSGGDPMIMSAETLERYIDPLLVPEAGHIQTLRFCTKALAYWPYRFTTDPDADDLLRLLERCIRAGRHVSIMAHVSHARELQPQPFADAIRRLKSIGVVIRAAGPIVRGVNDTEDAWFNMWRECIRQGIVPYYMYVERGTGSGSYFSVTLAEATRIYRNVVARMSGLIQTARGPVMATSLGKIVVDGIGQAGDEEVFACRILRARDPALVGIPFFARYDEKACWFDELRPAFGQRRFFFEAV